MNKLKITQKEYQKLCLLLITTIGKRSHTKDRKKFESSNKSIALNILYVPHNTKEIRHAHKSKYNFNGKNQVILLMTIDGKKMALPCCEMFVCII